MRDNLITSNRRTTPVQEQRVVPSIQQVDKRQLFPHPPTQHFNPPVIPPVETRNLQPQGATCESREASQDSLKMQRTSKKGTNNQQPPLRQLPLQRSSQDSHMDPHYWKPPQYSQIQQHQQVQPPPVEVNKMGPTIQQGVIQHPVGQSTHPKNEGNTNPVQSVRVPQMGTSTLLQNHDNGNTTSDPGGNGRDRLPDRDHNNNDNHDNNSYVVNCIHEKQPLLLNDIARPVFVSHYYAGESLIPVTSKKLIQLDECDVSTENSVGIMQTQATNHEYREPL